MLVRRSVTSVKLSVPRPGAGRAPHGSPDRGGLAMRKLLASTAVVGLMLCGAGFFASGLFAAEPGSAFGRDAKYRSATLDEARTTVGKWLDKLDPKVANTAI